MAWCLKHGLSFGFMDLMNGFIWLSRLLPVNPHQHVRMHYPNTSGCRDDLKKISKIVTSLRILQPSLLGRPSMKGFENCYKIINQHEQTKVLLADYWRPYKWSEQDRWWYIFKGNVFYLLFQIKTLFVMFHNVFHCTHPQSRPSIPCTPPFPTELYLCICIFLR